MTDNVRVSKDEASVNKAVILGLTSRVTDYDMVGCSCEAEVELNIYKRYFEQSLYEL